MKEGITYKRLGDLVRIRTGKLDANAANEGGKYPFFTCAIEPLRINTFSYDCECVLIAGNGDLNVKYYNGKFDAYQRTYIIEKKEGVDYISVPYLYRFFELYIEELRQGSIGGIIKYIKLGNLTEARIPIPSLDIQRSIVYELDAINAIIADKKQQLAELDTLAQAIFYNMFGDPITNDKGWEVKKIGEIGKVERGAGISKKDFVEDGSPCIHYGQLHTSFGAFTTKHISCIPSNLIEKPRIAHYNDVLMAITSEDVEGSCKSTAWMADYDVIVGSDAAIFHHSQNGIYISYYTRTKAFYIEKEKYANGFKVTHISAKDIENIPIPLPPLPLQQAFAAKIEAIEQQKSAVRASLTEFESLLAQRLEHHFA